MEGAVCFLWGWIWTLMYVLRRWISGFCILHTLSSRSGSSELDLISVNHRIIFFKLSVSLYIQKIKILLTIFEAASVFKGLIILWMYRPEQINALHCIGWKFASCVVIAANSLSVTVLSQKTNCQKHCQCDLHWTGNFVLIECSVPGFVFVQAWREAADMQAWITSIKFWSLVY